MISPSTVAKRLLIADDDPAIADALKTLLEDEGYAVEVSHDGAALMQGRHGFPDLLLLDIWFPNCDGPAICRHFKANDETKQIPIIMISANRDTKAIARAAGADDFIEKPFDIDDVIEMVAKYTG